MSSTSAPSDQDLVRRAPRIAVVAALEREVAPLVRHWNVRLAESSGRRYRLFEKGSVSLVCGGIGREAARRATEAIIQQVRPSRIVSVGFVGALDLQLRVGEVLEPRTVVDAQDGSRTDTGRGDGMLVSFASVANRQQKDQLRKAYPAAIAVDMEAAAVAQGAQLRGVPFSAWKVVSDVAAFDLPDMERFIGASGEFRTARFAFHAAMRPWLWRSTISLARNSAKASRALCAALEQHLSRAEMEESVKEAL